MVLKEGAKKFAKDSAIVLVANMIGFIGSIARGFIVPNFVSVSSYGSFNFLMSLNAFFLMLSFGVSASLPVLLARKNAGGSDDHKLLKSGFGVIIASYFIIFIILIFFILIFRSKLDQWLIVGLPIFVFAYLAQEIANYNYGIARTKEHFRIISTGILIFNLFYLMLSVILTYLYKFNGLALSFFLSNLALSIYYISKKYVGWPDFTAWAEVKEMVNLGFKQNISTLLSLYLVQVDRFVLMLIAGSAAVGIYALAFQMSQLSYIVLSSLIQVLSTKIYIECAKSKDTSKLSDIYSTGIISYAIIAVVLSAMLYLIAGPIIQMFLPKYSDSIGLTKLLVWLPVFQTISNISAMVIIGTRGIGRINVFLGLIGLIAPLMHYLLFRLYGIKGICLSTLIISCGVLLLHVKIAADNINSHKNIRHYLFPISMLLLYTIATCWAVDIIINTNCTMSTARLLWLTSFKIGIELIFVSCYLAVIWWMKPQMILQALSIARAKSSK